MSAPLVLPEPRSQSFEFQELHDKAMRRLNHASCHTSRRLYRGFVTGTPVNRNEKVM